MQRSALWLLGIVGMALVVALVAIARAIRQLLDFGS
jgi:hypothetical protein